MIFMKPDLHYFKTVQGAVDTPGEAEYKAANARDELREQFMDSINYVHDARRNGVRQPMIITGSEVRYKYDITTMPGDELYPGDMIEADGEHYIVITTRSESPVYVVGLAWLCNVKIRFQNWSPEIYERYAVLDSGVYSTTTGSDGTVTYLKRQFKIYMSSDEHTDKIFIDKRLAVGTMYDQYGNEILEAYTITGRTKFAYGYGYGAHLLSFNAKSSEQVGPHDSLEEMICDYIAEDTGSQSSSATDPPSATLPCLISGRASVRVGGKRSYSGVFYDANGDVCTITNPLWAIEADDGITMTTDGASCVVTVPDDDSLCGSEIVLRLGDGGVDYRTTMLIVEVE